MPGEGGTSGGSLHSGRQLVYRTTFEDRFTLRKKEAAIFTLLYQLVLNVKFGHYFRTEHSGITDNHKILLPLLRPRYLRKTLRSHSFFFLPASQSDP